MTDTQQPQGNSTKDQKLTLTELLKGFCPAEHRYTAEERPWDDAPTGREFGA